MAAWETSIQAEALWYNADDSRISPLGFSMTADLIDGLKIAARVHDEVRVKVESCLAATGRQPGLAVVLVGDDPASRSYVRRKERACADVGILTETLMPSADTSETELLGLVGDLNRDTRYDGILIQLPLPPQLSQERIINAIDPMKDVDGLHPENAGLLVQGSPRFVPATPLGVQRMLLEQGIDTRGANVVVLGRSNLVGRPLSLLLGQRGIGGDATVTVCHTRTRDVARHTSNADIVVAAAGASRTVTADMLGADSVVIDVGVNRVADSSRKSGYRLVGDVDFDSVYEKVAAITPVPGGVGPMTVAMLLHNVVLACELRLST